MVFRSFLTEGAKVEVTASENDYECICTSRIGEDDQRKLTYSLFTFLRRVPAASPGTMEFGFCVIEHDDVTMTETRVWDGQATKGYLQGPDRGRCLYLLHQHVRVLITRRKPTDVFIQTWDANLPRPALVKYEIVMKVFADCGYMIEECPLHYGRRSWWLTHDPNSDPV